MKIIMERKEARTFEKYVEIVNSAAETTKLPASIMNSYRTTTGEYIIDISPKYIIAILGESNKWLPTIIFSLKSFISLLQNAIERITDVELKLLNEALEAEKADEDK